MSDYVQTHAVTSNFSSAESWSILSDIERSIKAKIQAIGVPLREWDIQINYGIKTGFNEAFIIDSVKRDEILKTCQSIEERDRTAELIRPILRGRDIKRYGYDWANQYIVATFPSRHYNIDDYPALKEFLLSFGTERLEQTGKEYIIDGEKVKARKKTNNKWFETQDSISYWDEFSKPKMVWGNLNTKGSYALAPEDMFINAPACMIVPGSPYLLAMLNSKVADYYIRNLGVVRNGGFFEYKPMFVEQIPVPLPQDEIVASIEDVFNSDAPDDLKDKRLEDIVESMFDFTEPEIAYLRNL